MNWDRNEHRGHAPEIRRVRTTIRPPRTAIGVRKAMTRRDWRLLLAHLMDNWGSYLSTIFFPQSDWRPGSIWDLLLQRFDPDLIYLMKLDRHMAGAFRDRYDPLYLGTVRLHQDLHKAIFSEPRTGIQPVTSLARAIRAHPPTPSSHLEPVVLVNCPDSLGLIFAREYGFRSESFLTAIEQEFGTHRPEEAQIDLRAGAEALDRILGIIDGKGPSAADRWNCCGIQVEAGRGVDPKILVLGGTIGDVCLWLSLRCIEQQPSVLWLPDDMIPTLRADKGSLQFRYAELVAGMLNVPWIDLLETREQVAKECQPLWVVSHSLSSQEVFDRVDSFSIVLPGEVYYMHVIGQLPPELRPGTLSIAAQVEDRLFMAAEVHGRIASPAPEWLAPASEIQLRYVTEVEVPGVQWPTHPAARPLVEGSTDHRSGRHGPVADNRSMLLGSKRGSLMPVSGDQLAQWTKFDPRIGSLVRGGFVRMGEEIVDFSLTRRDTQGLLQGYATHLRGSIDVSDSGKYARELARRFGGLSEAVAALTSAVFAPLLWEYNPASGDRMGKTKLRDRRYLSHGAACQALGGSLSETERRDYMSELVERGLVHYGLLLTCPRCSSTEFYRWADMGERYVICIRCREEFQVTPSRFRYWEPTAMLAEVAFLGLFEKHALEEIALAAALEKDSAAALELGVRWRLPEGAGFLELETDVVGSVDGEFVIGEAKSVAKLNSEDNKQLNRLSRLAELTHARRLVIGTSEPQWPPPALKRLTELATRVHGVRVEAWANVLGKPQGTSINATGKWP